MEDYSTLDYIAILRRRRKEYFGTALVLLFLTCVFTSLWSTYKSTATIQIQAPDIPEGVTAPSGINASGFIEALADQHIQQIQQKIMASSNLVDIITKLGLYADNRRVKPMTEIVEVMRKKIKLELVSTELSNPASAQRLSAGQLAAIAFTISFKYGDPVISQQVTNELVSRFLDEDMKQRRQKARETAAFLGQQITILEQTMVAQEQKIADFRQQHANNRPEALAFNQQMAATTSINLQDIERQMNALEKAHGDLLSQLAGVDPYSRVIADGQVLSTPAIQLKALEARYSTLSGQYGASHPDVLKLSRQIGALRAEVGKRPDTADLQSQIADTRTNLAAAERTYGSDHPDVQALRRQLKAQQARLAATGKGAAHNTLIKKDADNPAYLMLVSQLQAAESQLDALTSQRDQMRQQRDHYLSMVAETPLVEQEFATLSRDYDNAQLRYRELKEKKMAADMGEQMEQSRKSERLVVIDPPELPTKTSPPRNLLALAGLVLSLLGGFIGVVLAETLSNSVHGTRHLTDLVGTPPLAAIPLIITLDDLAQRRRFKQRAVIIGGCVLILGLVIVDQAVMPLEVIWGVIANLLNLK